MYPLPKFCPVQYISQNLRCIIPVIYTLRTWDIQEIELGMHATYESQVPLALRVDAFMSWVIHNPQSTLLAIRNYLCGFP